MGEEGTTGRFVSGHALAGACPPAWCSAGSETCCRHCLSVVVEKGVRPSLSVVRYRKSWTLCRTQRRIVEEMVDLRGDRLNWTPEPVVLKTESDFCSIVIGLRRLLTVAYRRLGADTSCVCGASGILASKPMWKGSAQLIDDRRRS